MVNWEFVVFCSLITFTPWVTMNNELVTFETGGCKIREIKMGESATSCQLSTAVDPAKRDAKRA